MPNMMEALQKAKTIGPSPKLWEGNWQYGIVEPPTGIKKLIGPAAKSEKAIMKWMDSLSGEGQEGLKKDFHTKFIENLKAMLEKQGK